MSDAPRYTTLTDYVRVLRDNRWLVTLVVVVFGGVAFAYSTSRTPVYRGTAVLAVSDTSQDASTLGNAQFPALAPEALASRSAASVSTLAVATEVASKLRQKVSPRALSNNARGLAQQLTNLVEVRFDARDGETAAALANAFAAAVRDLQTADVRRRYRRAANVERRSVEKVTPKGDGPVNVQRRLLLEQLSLARISSLESLANFATPVRIFESASVPETPISPHPVRDTFLGLLIGLTVALIVSFMRDALDRRLRTAEEIRTELNLPLIGHIRDELMGRAAVGPEGLIATEGQYLEAFRIIRNNVDYLNVDTPARKLLVTSALPSEGKSTVAVGLAMAHAVTGRRVLLVECDLRRPVLAERLGLKQSPGLSDFLAGHATPVDVLQVVPTASPTANGDAAAEEGSGLVVITAGSRTSNPAEMLASQRFKDFIESVGEAYDFVVLDTTPLLSVVDALELIPQVDGVVVCARSVQTTRDQLRSVRNALDRLPDCPAGVVVTGLSARDDADYGYYSYAYAYGQNS